MQGSVAGGDINIGMSGARCSVKCTLHPNLMVALWLPKVALVAR